MRETYMLGCASSALVAALLISAPAHAQEASPDGDQQRTATAQPDQQDARRTGDPAQIVVTAQRRAELLEDVPLAMQALQGEALQETGYRDLRDIITLVPGASEGRGNAAGIRSYQIRGVSSFYGDSTVGYYVDEAAYVVVNRNYSPVGRSFDVDRIEVLRGPQGTLYGLGSMGGTIRFLTADPDLTNFRARGDVGISGTGEGGRTNYYGDIALSAPILPGKLAVRGVASYEKRSGFAQSPSFPGDYNNTEYQNYRVKLLAQPVDELTIKLGYHHNVTSDDWGQNFASVDPAAFPGSRVPGRNKQVYDLYTGFLSYDFGPFAIESSTGYVDRQDNSVGPIVFIGGPPGLPPVLTVFSKSDNFVQEVRAVSSGDTPFQWVLGGIYMDGSNLEDIKVAFGPPISAQSVYESKNWAIYGEASYGFLDDTLRALVGLRYFEDKRDFTSVNRPPGPIQPPPFVTSADFNSLSPRFNLSWQPNDDVMVYANVAKGYRSGTFNNAAAVSVSAGQVGYAVAPDKIWSYELGSKLTLMEDKLFLELVGYRFDWNDIQLNYTVAGGVQVIRNAGNVNGKGFEWALNWRAVPGLTLQTTGNVNSTKIVSLINPAVFAPTPNIAVGKQLTAVPKFTASVGATYDAPSGIGTSNLFLNAMYTHQSRQGDAGDPLGRLGKSHDLLRARAGLKWDNFGIYAFGENLLGDKEAVQISGSGITRYYPRVLGVEIGFDF